MSNKGESPVELNKKGVSTSSRAVHDMGMGSNGIDWNPAEPLPFSRLSIFYFHAFVSHRSIVRVRCMVVLTGRPKSMT